MVIDHSTTLGCMTSYLKYITSSFFLT